jgi:hypothetical protein
VTDVVLEGRNAALQCLQKRGVLDDMALDAMNSLAPEAASPRRKGAARKRPHVQREECFVTSSVSSIAVAAPLR